MWRSAVALLVVAAAGCADVADGEGSELDPNDLGSEAPEAPEDGDPNAGLGDTVDPLSLPFPWGWWRRDAGARDAGETDAGAHDGGLVDAGVVDAGSAASDASARDAQAVDAAIQDASAPVVDAAQRDARVADAASRDAGSQVPDASRPDVAPGRSEGCGRTASGNDAFETRTLRVSGTDRKYHVRVPASYDKNRAYPVVFRFHGHGGNGLSGGLDIQHASGANAIIAAADGLNSGWSSASEASDLALFDAMLEQLSQQYCVDLGRVFAYGFSAGGGMTNEVGCKRASKIRATAAIAGFDRGDASCDRAPTAAWFQHDVTDPAVSIAQGRAARDRAVRRSGCSTETTYANGCVSYAGCKTGFPVVWCETNGLGHDIAGGTAPAKVWEFFSKLP